MLKRVDDRRHPCFTPTIVLNHSPMLAIHLDCTCSLVVEMFNGSNWIYSDIVLPHGGP